MAKVIIHTNEEGLTCITQPMPGNYIPVDSKDISDIRFFSKAPTKIVIFDSGTRLEVPDLSWREATIEEIAKKDIPEGQEWHIVDSEDFAGKLDPYFREAWVHDKGSMSIHMDKAKELHKNKLRLERIEAMSQLDVDFQRAIEDNDSSKMQRIKAKKQKLRDITTHPDLVNAQTPEELKAVTIETHGV